MSLTSSGSNASPLDLKLLFSQKGVVNLLRTEDVDCIYTDSDIPSEVEEYLLGKNIEVCKVNP